MNHVTSKDICLYVASLHGPELAFLHQRTGFFSWHSTVVESTCHEVEVISPNVIDIWEAVQSLWSQLCLYFLTWG